MYTKTMTTCKKVLIDNPVLVNFPLALLDLI